MVANIRTVVLLVTGLIASALGLNVSTAREIIAWKGENVDLKCAFGGGDPDEASWGKVIGSSLNKTAVKAKMVNGNLTDLVDRFTMDLTRDYSLTIRDVRVSDEGTYLCRGQMMNHESTGMNYTLIVNAFASDPIIQQCGPRYTQLTPNAQPDTCTIHDANATLNDGKTNLDCKVSGFKPNVSLEWLHSGVAVPPDAPPTQRRLPDGTYERSITISVNATPAEDQTYTCRVRGEAVNGTGSVDVIILAVTESPVPSEGLSTAALIGIVVVGLLGVAILVLLLTALRMHVKEKRKKRKYYSQQDEEYPSKEKSSPKKMSHDDSTSKMIKLLNIKKGDSETKKKKKKEPEPDPEQVRLREWAEVAPEMDDDGLMSSEEDKDYPLTETVALYDSCDIQSFALELLDDVVGTVKGSNNPHRVKESAKKASITKSVIFFCQDASYSTGKDLEFNLKFIVKLGKYYGPKPLFVVPVEVTPELQEFKRKVMSCDIPEKNIIHLEHYTRYNNSDDLEIDIKLLDFVKAARDEVSGPRHDEVVTAKNDEVEFAFV